ncbi:hypothetical protein, partial [Escherichia coli]|uniref:hypothetical protein n=1 Tax=Escherichia coli TaxID=562 RepID=UPI001BC89CF0
EKRVFLVILFTSFSGSLVSRIPGAVQVERPVLATTSAFNAPCRFSVIKKPAKSGLFQMSMSAIRLAVQLCEAYRN